MSETKRRGYRSVSVRAPVFDRLLDIAQREGLNSAAEAVEYLTAKYYEETLLRGTSTIEAVVARLFFNDKRPGEIIESYQGKGAYPLVFLTYDIIESDGAPTIMLAIGVNPLPILLTYCTGRRSCDITSLELDLLEGVKKMAEKAVDLLNHMEARIELLSALGINIHKQQLEALRMGECPRKRRYDTCHIPVELRIPLENLEAAREHLATMR